MLHLARLHSTPMSCDPVTPNCLVLYISSSALHRLLTLIYPLAKKTAHASTPFWNVLTYRSITLLSALLWLPGGFPEARGSSLGVSQGLAPHFLSRNLCPHWEASVMTSP